MKYYSFNDINQRLDSYLNVPNKGIIPKVPIPCLPKNLTRKQRINHQKACIHEIKETMVTFKNNTKHLRLDCIKCKKFMKYKKQSVHNTHLDYYRDAYLHNNLRERKTKGDKLYGLSYDDTPSLYDDSPII